MNGPWIAAVALIAASVILTAINIWLATRSHETRIEVRLEPYEDGRKPMGQVGSVRVQAANGESADHFHSWSFPLSEDQP